MPIKNLIIDRGLIKIDPEEVLSLLGAKEAESDSHTIGLTEEMIGRCSEMMTPQGGYLSIPAVPADAKDEIATESSRFLTGRTITKMLRGSETYAFFVASAGYGPEELSRKLINEGNYLEGYIADLVGSAIAESVAIIIHDHIKTEAEKNGLKVSNRYSPGYCGWEVVEQQKLFSLFPEGCCGITLSESSLMSPIKSVSGIVGTGASVSFRDYTCEICSMKTCIFRRTRSSHPHHSPE